MEKRALVALLLSFLVFLIWSFYFTPKEQYSPPPNQKHGETAQQTSPPSEPKAPIDAGALPRFKISETLEGMQTWIIDTPLYEAKILQPGARLLSFTLKKHRAHAANNAPPMELVTAHSYGYLPCALEFLHHQDMNLSTIPYEGQQETKVSLTEKNKVKSLEFRARVDGVVEVVKRYNWKAESYDVDLDIEVTNISGKSIKDSMGLSFYFLPFEDLEQSFNKSHLSYSNNKSLNQVAMKKLKKEAFTLADQVNWIGFENNYFIQALIPMSKEQYTIVGRIINPDENLLQLVYISPEFTISPGETHNWQFRMYLGPKEMKELQKAGHFLSASIDYGWVSFLAKPLLNLLVWFYRYVHNYGIAIILLTVLIKLLFWPLTHKSYKSMRKMKEIQPHIARIREKYKDDREKLNRELIQLYRTYKINPMGGCLPILIQIPFFFALYRMLYSSVELRHQPFCLWIDDLTAPDRLFIGFHIPYLGGIPVLTLLMGLSMFLQQKMSPSPGDPRQEKIMLLMPVIFTVFFVNFPSGLVLYWFVNNVLSIVQQFWINRAVS